MIGEPRTTVLRVDPRTVIIFSVMLSPALFVAAELLWSGRQLPHAALLCGLYAMVQWWMCGRTVELVPGRLIYRVFFTTKVIDVSNVAAAEVVARPAPTLELRHEGSCQAVPAFIVKPFSRTGVAAILDHIRQSSPNVKLARVAQDMSQGRFDTITREAVKAMNLLRLVLLVAGMLVAGVVVRLLLT